MAIQRALRTLEEEDRQIRAITGKGFTPRGYDVRQKSVFEAERASQRQAQQFGLQKSMFEENKRQFNVNQARLNKQMDDQHDADTISGIGQVVGIGGDILDIVSGGKSLVDIFGSGGGTDTTPPSGGSTQGPPPGSGQVLNEAIGGSALGPSGGVIPGSGVQGGSLGTQGVSTYDAVAGVGTEAVGAVGAGATASGLASGAAGAAGVNAAGAGAGGVGGAFGGATPAMTSGITGTGTATTGGAAAGATPALAYVGIGAAAAYIAYQGYQMYTEGKKGPRGSALMGAYDGNLSDADLGNIQEWFPAVKTKADATNMIKAAFDQNPGAMEQIKKSVSTNRDVGGTSEGESPYEYQASRDYVSGKTPTYAEFQTALVAEKSQRTRDLETVRSGVGEGSNYSQAEVNAARKRLGYPVYDRNNPMGGLG